MSLYATALSLDVRAMRAMKVTDGYSVHRLVYGLFEDVRSEKEKAESHPSGIQYVDMGWDSMVRKVLVLSDRAPLEQPPVKGLSINTRVIDNTFLSHDLYSFKITLNPTRRNNVTRKLEPIKGREAIAQWLTKKADDIGFEVVGHTLEVISVSVDQFEGKNGHLITHQKALVQGQLRVTDRDAFISCFSRGIGRGRAFGCGLLQIVPIIDSVFN